MKFGSSSRAPAGDAAAIGGDMVTRADAARDARQFPQAAFLYEEALRLLPGRAGLHVQAGHMFKEASQFDKAEQHYAAAAAMLPNDAELALQLGHFFKTTGQIGRAAAAYRRSLALKPGWDEPKGELAALDRAGWRAPDDLPEGMAKAGNDYASRRNAATLLDGGHTYNLAPELSSLPVADVLHAHSEEIATRRLGRPERTHWGLLNTLRGVQSFRGFCISKRPVLKIELLLNGQMIYRGGLRGGYEIPHEAEDRSLRKYVFNAWIDLSGFVEGQYEVEYRAIDIDNRVLTRREQIVIAPPRIAPAALPDSDTNVPSADPADPRSLDEQINNRPSMVRPARRALFKEMPRTILVQRPDVLGDLAVSVPALKRLRSLFPDALIVGLVSNANFDLAKSLGLFDEMVVTELSHNMLERRRVVPLEEQKSLAGKLAPYKFDLAIDLGTSPDSRLLLPLSGAPVLVGFRCDQLPGLTVEVTGGTSDAYNGHEIVPHTNMAMGLIEWLAAMMRSELNLVKREDLSRDLLASFGMPAEARFIVLHAGGRWQFSRWPHYLDLARIILEQTGLHIVFMTNDADAASSLPDTLAGSDRFHLLDRRLLFDELDALLTFSTVFVGDDSGVKHLASLRGAQVIGIHNARNNWSEWGQDNGGFIITRKVPCAGCLIQNYPESDECGRDFVCITAIRPSEVFDAIQQLAGSSQ
jgi:ADP-heptose:LPS heptosyltransferase/tetratricopeptide (TPR) repeat protein